MTRLPRHARRLWALATLVLLALCLAACGSGGTDRAPHEGAMGGGGGSDDPRAFRILAGSELKDVEQQLKPELEKAAGAPVTFVYGGTLDAIDRIAAGERFDAVWVSHGKYLAMNPALQGKILAQDKTMLSPVVLGLRASKAKELGWDARDPTWKEIAEAAEAGRFTFGMTNPASSNSGFTAMMGLAAALAQTPDALSAADARNPKLAAFFKGQRLTAGSSGWLAEAYTRDPSQVDGLINYESVLLSLNREGRLREKLTLVYPKEGIVTADYPLMLLNAAKRSEYDRLIAAIRSPAFQSRMSALTLRRPVVPEATTSAAIPAHTLVELPFPGDVAVVDALLAGFLSDVRIPGVSRYVLDLSGSMRGERLQALKEAMAVLDGSGGDGGNAARFARFQNREEVGLITFSSKPDATQVFRMGANDAASAGVRRQIATRVAGLEADGGTAIYDSVEQALRELAAQKRAGGAPRYYSVVLMTDGENTSGADFDDFRGWYQAQDALIRSIKVFPIVFGDADSDEMRKLAELTGGRSFDARKGSLALVFKDIRGYQ